MAHVMRVRLTTFEEVLGSAPADPNILSRWIASNAKEAAEKTGKEIPDENFEQEADAIKADQDAIDNKMTVFPRMTVGDDDDIPCLWDYQVRGMFKDSIGMLRRIKDAKGKKMYKAAGVTSYKKVIDGLVFVNPREIPYMNPDGTPAHVSGICERPLRASGPTGERVALAASEVVPAGVCAEFEIVCIDPSLRDVIVECLDYGRLRGLGQWRNSGKGRYTWELLEERDERGF